MNWRTSLFTLVGIIGLMGSCKKVNNKDKKNISIIDSQKIKIDPKKQKDCVGKKRVLIFVSTGGGAHISASKAIISYFDGAYETEVVNMIRDVLHPLDPILQLSGNSYNGEDLYDTLIRRQFVYGAQVLGGVGGLMIRKGSKKIEALLEDFIVKRKPDLIVSVMPFLNGALYNVAVKLELPMLLIPPDLDVTTYCNGLKKPTYEKFIFGIPFDDPEVRKRVKNAGIPDDRIRVVGFPVRQTFFEKPHPEKSRCDFNIPSDKPVVMVLMGSAGSRSTLRYAKEFAKFTFPIHAILCLGRNEQLRYDIEQLQFPSHVTVSTIGFTEQIADLMAASDVIITKSGPSSMCEALYMRKPIIVDHTMKILWWERINVDFVIRNGFGQELRSIRKLETTVQQFFTDQVLRKRIATAMEQYKLPDVRGNVTRLVDSLLQMNIKQ